MTTTNDAASRETHTRRISWQLFLVFLRIGAFTIGGGYVMVPLIQQEIIRRKKWLTEEQFLDMLAVAQSAPGILAINTAVITGYKLAGLQGALLAACGAALPSFVIILLIASFFLGWYHHPAVQAFFRGARPAVVALLLSAAYTMGKGAIKDQPGLGIGLGGLLVLLIFRLHPILAIFSAGLLGLWFYRQKTKESEQ